MVVLTARLRAISVARVASRAALYSASTRKHCHSPYVVCGALRRSRIRSRSTQLGLPANHGNAYALYGKWGGVLGADVSFCAAVRIGDRDRDRTALLQVLGHLVTCASSDSLICGDGCGYLVGVMATRSLLSDVTVFRAIIRE